MIANVTDSRLDSDTNGLSKSLKCLKELKIVDTEHPNVLAILTHACGIPHKKVEKWSEIVEARKSIVRKLMFEYLTVTAPVVLMENWCGEDYNDLEVSGHCTRLPNGDLQPKNLYEACKELLEENKDGLGLITFTIVVSLPKKEPTKPGHRSEAKYAERPTLEHSGDSTRRPWCEICNKDFLMKNNGLVLIIIYNL